MAREVAPTNQWREAYAKNVAAVAALAYFVEHADGYLEVTDDPDEATHSWAYEDGELVIVDYREDSRMVLLGGEVLMPTVVPELP